MLALLLVLFYGGVLWLALMGLGYLRPRWIDTPVSPRPDDVDLRSPHAILKAGMAGSPDHPVAFPPLARERIYSQAMAIAARKPYLLYTIGHVMAALEPTTPEEVDVGIEATVASVEGSGVGPGASRLGRWHPIVVRSYLEQVFGAGRHFFYLPMNWDGQWRFLAFDNASNRRRPKANELSLSVIAFDAPRVGKTQGRVDAGGHQVASRIEGREHAVDSILLWVEGDPVNAVALRDRLAIVASGIAAGLLAEPLPEDVVHAIRRGHDIAYTLSGSTLTYTHGIDRPYPAGNGPCVAIVEFARHGALT